VRSEERSETTTRRLLVIVGRIFVAHAVSQLQSPGPCPILTSTSFSTFVGTDIAADFLATIFLGSTFDLKVDDFDDFLVPPTLPPAAPPKKVIKLGCCGLFGDVSSAFLFFVVFSCVTAFLVDFV